MSFKHSAITLVSFIQCHMTEIVLRHFEAGLGSSVSTIILSKVAVALFVVFAVVCWCVQRGKGTSRAHWKGGKCGDLQKKLPSSALLVWKKCGKLPT